jgi:hypothetical protein
MNRLVPAAFGLFIATFACARRSTARQCIISDSRSALGWAVDGEGLHGTVLRLETSQPLTGAWVLLSPGDFRATSDSAGRFQFPIVPPGQYQVRVRYIGLQEARDSITYGLGGLRLMAGLAAPPIGLKDCAFRSAPPAR